MSNDKTYNGWTNYATWRVNLEMFDGLDVSDISFITDEITEYELGEELKEYAESVITNDEIASSNLAIDYAMAFLNDVNWSEIAKHKLDEINENYYRR